jgi:protein TonB
VANFQVHDRLDEPAPDLEVQLIEPPEFEVVVPLVSIHLETPPPSAISPPPPAPPRAVQASVPRDAMPVMLDASEVDYVAMPRVVYPRAAKQARVQGTVLLWVLIDAEGKPAEVRVHRSSGSEQLDRAGREAVLDCRFKPYRRDGVALSAQVLVPIEFSLTTRTARG